MNTSSLLAVSLLTVGLAGVVTAAPAVADETQFMLRFESSKPPGRRWSIEARYLPDQNAGRGSDRVDLQSLRLRSDFSSVSAVGVIVARDGDSNLVNAWEMIPTLTISKDGPKSSLEVSAFLANASFEGPWEGAVRSNTRSQARVALRMQDGRTTWWVKASPVAVPFNGDGFATSKAYPLRPAPAVACLYTELSFDPLSGRVNGLACAVGKH